MALHGCVRVHIGGHYRLPRNPQSETSRTAHECGPPRGERTGAEDHHAIGDARIHRDAGLSRPRSPVWMVIGAGIVSVLGDALIALAFLFIFFVFKENSYGA